VFLVARPFVGCQVAAQAQLVLMVEFLAYALALAPSVDSLAALAALALAALVPLSVEYLVPLAPLSVAPLARLVVAPDGDRSAESQE
jgi:hypothetical protein